MERSWRPRPPPPPGNTTPCPFCSNYHFPFCHPPLPQYFRPPPPPPPPDQFYPNPVPPPPPPPDQFYPNPVPPPPPDQFYPNPVPPPPLPPQYDPFVDHQAPPAVNPYNHPPPPPLPHSPWNSKPSFGHGNLDYEKSSSKIGGVKRTWLDNVGEDERRLKLIRDHGAVGHSPDRKYNVGSRFAGSGLDHGEKRGNFGIENGYSQEDSLDVKRKYGGEVQFAFCHGEDNGSLVRNHGYGNGVRGGADGYGSLGQKPTSRDCRGYEYGPYQDFNGQFPRSHATQQPVVNPRPSYYGSPNPSEIVRPINGAQGFKGQQPPLATSPPPPIPAEPPGVWFAESIVSSSAPRPSSLFPTAASSAPSMQSQYTVGSEDVMSLSTHYSSKANPSSRGYYAEAIPGISQSSSKTFMRDSGELPPQRPSLEKPKIVDAAHILKHPHRDSRPDHIVIILRGLPGSGKSYLAKILRDLEVENGGAAPRIHSMDDYFMTEVEENEGSRSSGTVKGKKQLTKKVMEYCYEPEMEEAYRSSMLKAFKKTLDEGAFPLVIVDDRNLRVADFAQFWATAKRSGYEVYLLEATYKDPAGCAARNVHSFTQNDIQMMADQWEEAPSLYMKLDIKSLLHGDDLEENGIQEVDMDTEDDNDVGGSSGLEHKNSENVIGPSKGELSGPVNDERERDDAAEDHPTEVVKELGKSKWSNVVDEDDVHKTEVNNRCPSARSGLIKSYSKKGKSVRWSDQVGKIGFSISAGKAANVSLVIGPGSGYNLKSNPLPEEEKLTQRTGEPKGKNVFQEQLRAERESFRAVFDKRRQRIRGIDVDEE